MGQHGKSRVLRNRVEANESSRFAASFREHHLHQNKDMLSVCRIHLLQRKPKLGRTKPSTGLRAGHSCFIPQVYESISNRTGLAILFNTATLNEQCKQNASSPCAARGSSCYSISRLSLRRTI